MNRVLLVAGHGPGIGDAAARRFAAEGFAVALAGRSPERLEAAADSLRRGGTRARAFTADMATPGAARALVGQVRDQLGPLTVIHWNVFTYAAGDLLAASPEELSAVLSIAATSLLEVVRAAQPDLQQSSGTVLLTGGGLATDGADPMAAEHGLMGLALCKAIQHKICGMLHHRLKGDGVHVAEVMVRGFVKSEGNPDGTVAPEEVADLLFRAHAERAGSLHTIP